MVRNVDVIYLCLDVHRVAILNAASCMTCCLLMLVEDTGCDHMEEAHFRAGLMIIGRHECLLLFAGSTFIICRALFVY